MGHGCPLAAEKATTAQTAQCGFLQDLEQERSWNGPQVTNPLDKDKIYVLDIQDFWLEKAPKVEA